MIGRWMADRPVGDLLDAIAPHRGSAGGTLFRDPALRRNALGERLPAFERYQALFFRYGVGLDRLLADRAERILVRRGVRPVYATEMANLSNGGDRRSQNQTPGLESDSAVSIATAAKTMGVAPVPLSWRCDCGRLNSRAVRCGCVPPWERPA